jgi:hypothetical protein
MLAQINRTALIIVLETHFGRVQDFGKRAGTRQILPEGMAAQGC